MLNPQVIAHILRNNENRRKYKNLIEERSIDKKEIEML